MTFDEAIQDLATALGVAATADAVATALRTRAGELRLGGVPNVIDDDVERLLDLASSILRRIGAEQQTAYKTPDVLAVIARVGA